MAEINGQSRQTELYATLITFLILNNATIAARLFAHWRVHYKQKTPIFLEDLFLLLSGIFVNVIIANLLTSTHYGLGLHSSRIYADDPNPPYMMTRVFQHVWICMVLTGPTFTFIKLALLFFYRRLFLVNQKWLRLAWWANLVYVVLWFFGATGFYIFQCWPVQWYWMRYYPRYGKTAPGGMEGQCNATTVQHVAMPLIFGLVSDVALLLLPITSILKLQISLKKKLGLAAIFSVGLLACLLELGRIVELEVDTDDKTDPSYGVVIFLILSVAEEVCAIICASLPVIGPQLFQEFKKHKVTEKSDPDSSIMMGSINRGFYRLGEKNRDTSLEAQNLPSNAHTEWLGSPNPHNETTVESPPNNSGPDDSQIMVRSEYKVTVGRPDNYPL